MNQRRRTIIIPFMGGLGNQLFQYAAGVYMQKILLRDPKYSLIGFSSLKNTPRSFMLGDLINEDDKATLGRLGLAFFKLLSFFFHSVWVAENSLVDFPLERVSRNSCVLLGYFQRHKYVDAVSTDLIKSLSLSNVFSPVFSSQTNNDIAVHIRFGDYLTNLETRSFHGLSAMSYYVEAVKFLESSHSYDKIMIYSDNQQKAFADFTYEYGLGGLPVSVSTCTSEYDDLAKISSSKGIVISNSTFSWWAAWIGTQLHECNVVAPKPWFAIPTSAEDNLLPAGWTVLNRDLQL